MEHPLRRKLQLEADRAISYRRNSSQNGGESAIVLDDDDLEDQREDGSGDSSATNSGQMTPQVSVSGSSSAVRPIPINLAAGVSASFAQQTQQSPRQNPSASTSKSILKAPTPVNVLNAGAGEYGYGTYDTFIGSALKRSSTSGSASTSTADATTLSPGLAKYELGSSFRDSPGLSGPGGSVPDSPGFFNEALLGPIGLQSFMSLNAPASPKRLSALELTFPSLDALGYSSGEDEDYDPGPYAVSGRGRTYRRTSSLSSFGASRDRQHPTSPGFEGDEPVERPTYRRNGSSRSESETRRERFYSHTEKGKKEAGRKRLSSFAEYGNKPPPTSLAILAGLIAGSARIIDRAYAEQGIPVPDIDDPGLPKSKYAKEQRELRVTNEVYKAVEVCIEACHQLVGIVQRPEVTCAEAAYAFELSAALKVTTEAHVVEVLREEGPTKGMHIVKLAERVGMDPHFLLRIMRLLAAHNIFLEMGAGSQWFANNRVSLRLDSKEPLSKVLADPPTEGPDNPRVELRSMISHATDYTWHSAGQIEERMKGQPVQQIAAADQDEASALLYRQLNARKCASYLGDPPNLINVLKSLGNGLVVDLGSGLGRDLLGVAKAYPHLRIELHDKPETMELAKDMWYRQAPRSIITKAVTFHPHDLLGPQKYPRGSTYLLRNHLVHWGDAEVLTILKKARASAFNSSRLFVEESTSDDELPSDLSFLSPAMLASLEDVIDDTSHNADRVQHLLDVACLLSGNGRKRTIIELVLLLEKAGWRTEKVDNSSGGRSKIFFCRPIKEEDVQ